MVKKAKAYHGGCRHHIPEQEIRRATKEMGKNLTGNSTPRIGGSTTAIQNILEHEPACWTNAIAYTEL